MTINSMTAYGQSVTDQSNAHAGEFIWEMRSVNHRHLDITVRLPTPFSTLEADVRAMTSKHVHRGKVDITLKLSGIAHIADELLIDEALLAQVVSAIQVVEGLDLKTGTVDPLSLLQWPGVSRQSTRIDDSVVIRALSSFEMCLADFKNSRAREGDNIESMLTGRAIKISALVSELREQRSIVMQRQRSRLLEKLNQLDVEHDASRLEQELAYVAQRLDIDEELDRLESHIQEFKNACARNEPVGRRMDFLMQEFNREANTVSSKSSDASTTKAAIDIKVLIEQMREQVQNVE